MDSTFQPVFRQLSNDTYFFFKYGEEPLDATNYEEIEELKEEYPNGFELADAYEYVDDDLIRVQLFAQDLPEIYDEGISDECSDDYIGCPDWDWTLPLFNSWAVYYKESGTDEVHAFFYNAAKGEIYKEDTWPIKTTKTGNKYLEIGKCKFPLKKFVPF